MATGIGAGAEDCGTTTVEFLANRCSPSCGTLLLRAQPARSKVPTTRVANRDLRAPNASATALAFMDSAGIWDGTLRISCTGTGTWAGESQASSSTRAIVSATRCDIDCIATRSPDVNASA